MTTNIGPSVYRLYSQGGRLLYVGMSAKSPHRRIGHHLQNSWWGHTIARFEIQRFVIPAEARRAEARAIATEMPRWNIDGKFGTLESRESWTEQDYVDFIVACLRRDGTGTLDTGWAKPAAGEFRRRFGYEPPTTLRRVKKAA